MCTNNFICFSKLITVLKDHIDSACNVTGENNKNILYKALKSLQYIFRFIVRSRVLFSELNEGKEKYEFEINFRDLLNSIVKMMCFTSDSTLVVQGACLKFLPTTITDILKVFDSRKLR